MHKNFQKISFICNKELLSNEKFIKNINKYCKIIGFDKKFEDNKLILEKKEWKSV